MKVWLGVCDDSADVSTTDIRSYNVSRVGGKPAWLQEGAVNVPPCPLCSNKRHLLIQLYAPLEESIYHRCLHVFSCVDTKCCDNELSWLLIRSYMLDDSISTSKVTDVDSQLQQQQQLHHHGLSLSDWGVNTSDTWKGDDCIDEWGCVNEDINDDSIEDEIEQLLEARESAAAAGGGGGGVDDASISIDKRKNSMMKRKEDERDIVDIMTDLDLSNTSNSCCLASPYPAVYINVLEEPSCRYNGNSTHVHDDYHTNELLEAYRQSVGVEAYATLESAVASTAEAPSSLNLKHISASDDNEGYEKAQLKHGDRAFHRFSKRIARCPDQVLRYSRGGKPLPLSDSSPIVAVPHCSACGKERIFEVQLVSTLINYIDTDMGWGSVLLYTCSADCRNSSGMSTETVVVVPDPDAGICNLFSLNNPHV